MCHGLRGGTEVRQSASSSISSTSTEGRRGCGAGAGLGAGFIVGFTGARVKEFFLVGADFISCFFPSNCFFFRSTSGSPLVVTFVESLHLRGPEASGKSVGIWDVGCGMWFRQMWIFFGDQFYFFGGLMPQALYSSKVCRLRCCAAPNTH